MSDTTGQAYFHFPTSSPNIVQVKVGLSYVSTDAAMANLNSENPNWDFDTIHTQTLAAWNAKLGNVQVEGTDDNAKKALYTGIYHALLQPAVNSDVDGTFTGFDGKTHNDPAHPRYSNYSGWDVLPIVGAPRGDLGAARNERLRTQLDGRRKRVRRPSALGAGK